MLSSEEYEKLLPYREEILRWKETGKYNGGGMTTVDYIRQKRGCRPLCYACDGNKREALNDAYHLIKEYEQHEKKLAGSGE